MTNTSHLSALENGLFNEEQRLKAATRKQEIELRTVWVKQYKKEIEQEKRFLGFEASDNDSAKDLSIDELLEALS